MPMPTATGDGDEENDELLLILPLSISGLLLTGFAISLLLSGFGCFLQCRRRREGDNTNLVLLLSLSISSLKLSEFAVSHRAEFRVLGLRFHRTEFLRRRRGQRRPSTQRRPSSALLLLPLTLGFLVVLVVTVCIITEQSFCGIFRGKFSHFVGNQNGRVI
jgi:hypothetical protein